MVDILPSNTGERYVPPLSTTSDAPDQVPSPEPAQPTPEPQSAPEPGPEPEPEPESEPQPEPHGQPEPERRRRSFAEERRANEERARRVEAALLQSQQINERLLGLLEQRTTAPQPSNPPPALEPAPRPQRQDFTDPDTYDAALIDWSANEGVRRATVQFEERRAAEEAARDTRAREERARTEQQEIADTWDSRVQTVRSKLPDFDDVVLIDAPPAGDWRRPDNTAAAPMRDAVMTSEEGPELAYHLARHPEEAARIQKLAPARQFVEIGKLAARLTQQPTTQASRAPPPPRPINGGDNAANPRDISRMSTEEYAAQRLPQLQSERRASMFGMPRMIRTN